MLHLCEAIGALEWIAAAALLIEPVRMIGCVIAATIMLGASSCVLSIRWCCWRCYCW
jgi:hypothetical protein